MCCVGKVKPKKPNSAKEVLRRLDYLIMVINCVRPWIWPSVQKNSEVWLEVVVFLNAWLRYHVFVVKKI